MYYNRDGSEGYKKSWGIEYEHKTANSIKGASRILNYKTLKINMVDNEEITKVEDTPSKAVPKLAIADMPYLKLMIQITLKEQAKPNNLNTMSIKTAIIQ